MIQGICWTGAQTRVRGSCLPSTACGRGVGGEGFLLVGLRKRQSGFARLPAPELLFSCVAKRKVTQREGHPDAALSGHRATAPALPQLGHPCPRHALRVREAWPGFSAGHSRIKSGTGSARSKRRVHPWPRPLRGLIVPASPPHRGPEEQRAPARKSNGQSKATQSAAKLCSPFFRVTFLDSGHPALRPSGQLRCSPPLPAVAWASKERWLGRRQATETALSPAEGKHRRIDR